MEKEILVYLNNVDVFFEIDILSGCLLLVVIIWNYVMNGVIVVYDFGDGGMGNIVDIIYVYMKLG